MILYHGTNINFAEIELSKSRPNKDFGKGFYLSDNYEQAFEMAKNKIAQYETGSPIVLEYEVDESQFKNLKVLRFNEYSEEWAKFILLNRNNKTTEAAHDYDVVIGPIANDRIGVQLWKFENEMINLSTLVKNLSYMKGITIQYYFGTNRAIKILKRL